MNKNLKTLLAVGGWVGDVLLANIGYDRSGDLFFLVQDMGMKDFAGIVKSDKTMKKFADSAVKYLRKHKFDGLDLGEFPLMQTLSSLFRSLFSL